MRYLVTGGCGFIGSHLCEALLRRGDVVVALDDLSTGRHSNVAHLEDHPQFQLIIGSVLDNSLVQEAVANCDAIFHLASAVGVHLIMEKPVHTIETIFQGTHTVLRHANRYRKPLLITSTSEVYGKSMDVPFCEDGDRTAGPTHKQRWAYACAKALDEFLALAYWKETRLPVAIVRLFNTVGPRQTGQYGMVVPNFVERALSGRDILVYGDGSQTRCFVHVFDVVDGLMNLMTTRESYGQVINIGSKDEISILELARLVKRRTESESEIQFVSYEEAYGEGFEEMQRRVPNLSRAENLIGWSPRRTLGDIIDDVVADVNEDNRSKTTQSGRTRQNAHREIVNAPTTG